MSIGQVLKIAWRNLWAKKIRFAQTLLGLIIGTAGLVMILNVQQASVNKIDALYKEFSPSLMMMATYRPVESSQSFTADDMAQLAADNPEYILAVTPYIFLAEGTPRYQGASLDDFGTMGVGEQYMAISPLLQLVEGRFLQPMDISREQNVCVISHEVAEALGGEALGKELRIMGQNFQVIGVLAEVVGDQEQFSGAIYIPYTVAQRLQAERIVTMNPQSGYTGDYYINQYYVNANGMENIANARITVSNALQAVYGENAIHYSASFRYYREGELTPVYSLTKKLLAAAGVVLLVGGIGIMNMMLAIVGERIGEIGVRKAFGARLADIRRQFLAESGAVSLIGGLLGVVLGLAGSVIICRILELPLRWLSGAALLGSSLLALALAVIIGVVFGTYPAQRAAKQEIVAAINSARG